MSSPFRITSKITKDVSSQTFAKLKLRAQVDRKFTKVGIPGTAKEPDDGTPLALIGLVMEFGSPEKGIPERPSLIPATRKGRPDFVKLNKFNLKKILRGETTLEKSLDQLGLMAVGKVQKEILNGEYVPLKEATIEARKRALSGGYKGNLAKIKGAPITLDKPLIWTGNFIKAFVHELIEKGRK